MSTASVVLVAVAGLGFVCSIYNWWAAHGRPSGGFDEYMDTAVSFALVSCVLLGVGWAVA
jgi:hypothetical protein